MAAPPDPNGAALPPPQGEHSHLDNPPNRNAEAYAGIIICVILVVFSAATRVSFMVVTKTRPKVEDFFAIAAFGIYIAYVYNAFWFLLACGYYVHQWDVRLRQMAEIFYIIHISTFIMESMMMCIKVAILLEWTRIFAPSASLRRTRTRDTFFWVCWAVLVLNVLYYSSVIIAGNLACTPYKRIWDKSVPGTCSFDTRIVLATSAGINLVSDLAILLLPQGKIWHLHMSTRKKISVSVVFSIGLMACAAAAVRLWAGVEAVTSEDSVYTIAPVALWCLVEMTCAFMVFCAPAIPKVFGSKGLFGKMLGLVSTTRGTSQTKEYISGSNSSRGPYHQKTSEDSNGPFSGSVTKPPMAQTRPTIHSRLDKDESTPARLEANSEFDSRRADERPLYF